MDALGCRQSPIAVRIAAAIKKSASPQLATTNRKIIRMQAKKEFTESWLQALMQSATNEAARRIRPWYTDIGLLSASEMLEGQAEAASRLWNYCHGNGLLPILTCTPMTQPEWKFEDDECFSFRMRDIAQTMDSANAFSDSLGIREMQVPLSASVTSNDWTNLIRKEAVRRAKPLNVTSIPQGTRIEVLCRGIWASGRWQIAFDHPDWLTIDQPGIFHATRPGTDTIDALMLDAISFASQKLTVATKLSHFQASDAPWLSCVDRLYGYHRSVLLSSDMGASPWFKRIWNSVWPVVYRERNKLRGPCDLGMLRSELAECFGAAPLLTEWMFVFARLLWEVHLGGGLGIAGDFRDS